MIFRLRAAKAALGIFSLLTFGHPEAATMTTSGAFSEVLPFGSTITASIPIASFDPSTGTLQDTSITANTTYSFTGVSTTPFAPFGTQTVAILNASYDLSSYNLPTVSTPVLQTVVCGNLLGCSGPIASSITTTQTAITSNSSTSTAPANGSSILYTLTNMLVPSSWTVTGTETVSGTVTVTRTFASSVPPPPLSGSSPLTRSLSSEYSTLSLWTGWTADYFTLASLVSARNLPTAIGLGFAAVIANGLSRYLGFLSTDPIDPNYMMLAVPTSVTIPANLGVLTVLATDEVQATSITNALLISNDRYQGAVAAGDSFWEQAQLNNISQLTAALEKVINNIPSDITTLDAIGSLTACHNSV